MYQPALHREDRLEVQHDLIRSYGVRHQSGWKGGELARREALQTELGRNEGAAPVRCSSAPGPPVGSITRVSASLKS